MRYNGYIGREKLKITTMLCQLTVEIFESIRDDVKFDKQYLEEDMVRLLKGGIDS